MPGNIPAPKDYRPNLQTLPRLPPSIDLHDRDRKGDLSFESNLQDNRYILKPELANKMQQSLKKMKKGIRKITDNILDEEKHLPYVLPERLTTLIYETGFTKEEIRRLYRAFKQYCPRGDSTRYAQIVFNSFDVDRDGIVTFGDLLAGVALIINGDTDEKLSWIFRFYDLNGDGRITRREMLAIVTAIYEMVHNGQAFQRMVNAHVDRFFERIDVDRDGVISKEEFMASCKNDAVIRSQLKMFDRLWKLNTQDELNS
ncbi:hypothetical protein KM043_004056 [Ampulex compressa]|nr:hypothetical protein KM043_004056 [Ampulex compressa]